jgi:high affinity Mn2+ porin
VARRRALSGTLRPWALALLAFIPHAPLAAQQDESQALPHAAAWSLHAQLTYQLQGHGAFDAPYEGDNSLQNRREVRGSYTTTFYAGRRLWKGAVLFANAELLAGQGVSRVLGLAGPPNGETYRVDSTELKLGLARLYVRQTFELGAETEPVEDVANRLAGRESKRRINVTVGKFSGTDIFDVNTYAHDPRTQFNNWSLWANAAWDYPADTRGYTWGLAIEWHCDEWHARFGSFMEPKEANGIEFDHDVLRAHGDVIEFEHEHRIGGRSGAVRLLAFRNQARMGVYRDALDASPDSPGVALTRRPGRTKYGFGLNAEQALTPDIGLFLRLGWNDGRTESWAFTEVERTLAIGISSAGRIWGRPTDRLGLALAVNGINADHRNYLAAGGYGFMLGDGRLTYGAERVADAYYSFAPFPFGSFALEVQRYSNPAFNHDRGPVTVYGLRFHLER